MIDFADRMGLLTNPSVDDVFGGALRDYSGDHLRKHGTLAEILCTIRQHWDPETYSEQDEADPDGELGRRIRQELLDLGDTFRLYDYVRSHGPNSRTMAETLPLNEVVLLIDEIWHEQAGCFSHLPSEQDEFYTARKIAINQSILGEFTKRVSYDPRVVLRWNAFHETRWYLEARALTDHAILAWRVNDPKAPDEVDSALHRISALALARAGSPEEHDGFIEAGKDAIKAILMAGIVADPVHQTLYEHFEPLLPFSELRLSSNRS